MSYVHQTYRFAEGELDGVVCPRCGSELVATDLVENDDGDLVQIAFCPDCPITDDSRSILVPRALRQTT